MRVFSGELVYTRFYSRKAAALLARLALSPQRQFSREELIEWLWPESEVSAGRASFRNALFSLRRQLEPPGLPSGSVLSASHSHVSLNPAAVTTDAARFEALISASMSGSPLEQEARLLEAFALYGGELLPGFYEDWVLAARERLACLYTGLLEQLRDLAEARQDWGQAISYALRRTENDPFDENANAALLHLLLKAGKPEAAKRHYAQLEKTFHTHWGELPPSALKALLPQSVSGTPPLPSLSAKRPAAELAPLSVQDRPPLASPPRAASPVSLPLTFTRFFGREAELLQLQTWFDDPDARLLTLTGIGGIGKTRLAVEASRRFAENNPASLALQFVSLADLTDAERIADALVPASARAFLPNASPLEKAVHFLNQNPALLIFDNFEQLLPQGADLLSALLQEVRSLRCLVTSRQTLQLDGEREMALAPLPSPADPALLKPLAQTASVQLFVDRAQRVRPDFGITPRNAGAVLEVCRRLEGLPLALELAAARAGLVTPAQMLTQLEHRLEFLVSRRRDLAPRHRSLKAALDWSFDLLSPELKRFCGQLSVFHGFWTLEAAQSVCERQDALTLLEELRHSSLIFTEEVEETVRFRMLEVIRDYCGEQVSQKDERAALDARHRSYYVELAEAIEPLLVGGKQKHWFDRLEAEHDNLRAVLRRCEAKPEEVSFGTQLSGALFRFWHGRGYLTEGRTWLETFLRLEEQKDALDPAFDSENSRREKYRARALSGAGLLAWIQGDAAIAQHRHEASLALSRRLDDRRGIAGALLLLSTTRSSLGDDDSARSLLEESLSIWRSLGEERGIAAALNNLAKIRIERGELSECEPLYQEALALYRRINSLAGETTILANLGILRYHQKQWEPALFLLEEALARRRQLGDRRGEGHALNSLGCVLAESGHGPESTERFEQALPLLREAGDRLELISVLGSLALLHCSGGEMGSSRSPAPFLTEALTLCQNANPPLKRNVIPALEALARREAFALRSETAARLFGTVEALLAVSPRPLLREVEGARARAACRTALGEKLWLRFWSEGRRLPGEKAAQHALAILLTPFS